MSKTSCCLDLEGGGIGASSTRPAVELHKLPTPSLAWPLLRTAAHNLPQPTRRLRCLQAFASAPPTSRPRGGKSIPSALVYVRPSRYCGIVPQASMLTVSTGTTICYHLVRLRVMMPEKPLKNQSLTSLDEVGAGSLSVLHRFHDFSDLGWFCRTQRIRQSLPVVLVREGHEVQ